MDNRGRECGAETVRCIRWVLAHHHYRVPLWFLLPHAPDYVWNEESERITHRVGTANAAGPRG